MEKLDMALPAGVSAYRLPDGRIFRIHLERCTPDDALATSDFIEVETRGYEINEKGDLKIDENLEPITVTPMRARIPMRGILEGTESARAGWVVKLVSEAELDTLRSSVRTLKNLPKTGKSDEAVIVGDTLYVYTDGLYEMIRRSRVTDLVSALPAAPTIDVNAFAL